MFSEKVHRYIYLFGLAALAFGCMMGPVPTSVPQMILMGNWLLEANVAYKWKRFKNTPLLWLYLTFFVLHLVGMVYTHDTDAGLNDLRIKMPMLALPLVFFTTPAITSSELKFTLRFFLLGALCNTLWCLAYTHLLHHNEVLRNASRFMSHIRLGLYLNIAVATCIYFLVDSKKASSKFLFALATLYFMFCFYALGLASGTIIFFVLLFIWGSYYSIKQRYMPAMLAIIVIGAGSLIYIRKVANEQLQLKNESANQLLSKTPWGSNYYQFENEGQLENGYYIFRNIELQEIKRVWNRRVPNDTFSYAPAHNLRRYEALLRYLTSMGQTKDSLSVSQLTTQDIENIKMAVPNVHYADWSFFHRRVYELVNEYENLLHAKKVNGNSLTMRPFFWKAALHVIQQHPLVGVGTGDVQQALNQAYVETQSPLEQAWYKRPHNQFLSITVAFGSVGLILFVALLIYPLLRYRKRLHVLYRVHFLVVVLSFLVEDTLETQAGETFFMFFTALFVAQALSEPEDKTVST